MKRFLIFMLITLAVQVSLAQSVDFPATEYTQDPKANFRLYKTKNIPKAHSHLWYIFPLTQ